jgi:hypothetical protein
MAWERNSKGFVKQREAMIGIKRSVLNPFNEGTS